MATDRPHSRSLSSTVTTVLLSAFARPDEGGIQRSVEQIAHGLAPDILLVAPPHPDAGDYDVRQPYQTLRRDILGGRGWPSWAWLVPWLWQQKRQGVKTIIFGHCSGACFTAPWVRLLGLNYVILVHGRDWLAEEARATGRLFAWILCRATWVGVNSTYVGNLMHQLGILDCRIVRTHPAVPDNMIESNRRPQNHRLLTVGRLVWRKNVETVLQAMPAIIRSFPDAHYDVVGDGPERGKLEAACATLEIQSHVTFHGQVSDQRRDELLRQAAVFVMAPRLSHDQADVEGLGLVYLEAAALGLPIIASRTGGVADIVRDGANGRLADPEKISDISENVQQIFREPRETEELAQKELIQQEFTWSVRNLRARLMLERQKVAADIGVVIPAYNSADTIGKTLGTLFAQTVPPQQVVIINDGSTDDITAAISPWRDRVMMISQTNAGAAAARNRGAAEINTDNIIFVDADISLRPHAFEQMARALQTHPEAAYAYPSFTFGPKAFRLFDFDDRKLRQMNFIHTTALIRRSAFPGFDPVLKKFQDWDLWLTMLERGHRGIWTGTNLFSVRQRAIGYSTWLPKFVYRLPFIGQGRGSVTIAKYRAAEQIIRTKHHLPPVA